MSIPSAISPIAGPPGMALPPSSSPFSMLPPAPPSVLPAGSTAGIPPAGNLSAVETTDGRILVSASDSITSPGDLILAGLQRLAGRIQGPLQSAGQQLDGMGTGGGLRDLLELQAQVGVATVEMQLSAGVAEAASQGTRTLLQQA